MTVHYGFVSQFPLSISKSPPFIARIHANPDPHHSSAPKKFSYRRAGAIVEKEILSFLLDEPTTEMAQGILSAVG